MSSKINIKEIFKGHFETLKVDGKYLKVDVFTFFVVPLILAISCIYFNIRLDKDIVSLFVNFGAIFTALLLSLLVLVYDQESKMKNAIEGDALKDDKLMLLKQLYHNISFAILCSVFLVFMCFFHSAISQIKSFLIFDIALFKLNLIDHILNPLIVLVVGVIFLVIVMILKRVHVLLFVE